MSLGGVEWHRGARGIGPCAYAPERLIGDRAYDSDPLDERLRTERGIEMIARHRIEPEAPEDAGRPRPATCPTPLEDRAAVCLAAELPASSRRDPWAGADRRDRFTTIPARARHIRSMAGQVRSPVFAPSTRLSASNDKKWWMRARAPRRSERTGYLAHFGRVAWHSPGAARGP